MNQKRPPLKILLSNHHLMSFQGSENFTFIIADCLKRNGHDVTIYSAYIGKLGRDFESMGVRTTSDLRSVQDESFDIAHVHHHINTFEVRHYFPYLPIVLLCHGIIFLETPPPLDLNISQYMATSNRVLEHMVAKGVQREKITLFRNMIDTEKFFPRSMIHPQPRNALILSNKIDSETEHVIRTACNALNIKTTFIGNRFRQVKYHKIPSLINNADIVFSLGRGAIEAMLCARIPIIFDYEGGDGMVTSASIMQNMTCNFSGNLYNARYTVEQLIDVIRQYQAADGMRLLKIATEYFAADKQLEKLIDIYYSHANSSIEPVDPFYKLILNSFVSSIEETRAYSRAYHSPLKTLSLIKKKIAGMLKK